MISSSSIVGLVATAATLTLAKTPSGFSPASSNDLVVDYGGTEAMNGVLVAKVATASAPTLATTTKLNGTSFAVIMVDLDVPSGSNGSTTTFLHWVQTGLSQASQKSTVNTTLGSTKAYKLSVSSATNTSALVAYTQPGPPNKAPTSHRYTQVLLDTTKATTAQMAVLRSAVQSRGGFNVAQVLDDMGMTSSVVAGNSFNVSAVETATSSTNSSSADVVSSSSSAAKATKTGKSNKTKTKSSTISATATDASTGAAAAASASTTADAQTAANLTQLATNATTSVVAASMAGGGMSPVIGGTAMGLVLAAFVSLVL